MMTEIATRLKPSSDTLRQLFLLSGNLCAYPSCGSLMMNAQGIFIGQVCHIAAAEKGGQRFDVSMTNEERRAGSNLLLLCYEHHKITDDVELWPSARLGQIKYEHQRRFADPERAMVDQLTDWTERDVPTEVRNLRRMSDILHWGHDDDELAESVVEANEFIERFKLVPIETRRFVGAVIKRAYKLRRTRSVDSTAGFGTKVLATDIKQALRFTFRQVGDCCRDLEAYGLGDLDQISLGESWEDAVRISDLPSGWPFWLNIAEFCQLTGETLDSFIDDLDFRRLDEE